MSDMVGVLCKSKYVVPTHVAGKGRRRAQRSAPPYTSEAIANGMD